MKKEFQVIRNAIFLLPVLWGLFYLISVGTASLPYEGIQNNMEKTALYYQNKEDFEQISKNNSASIIHHYADAILFNIIASGAHEKPVDTALACAFYTSTEESQGNNLYNAVFKEVQANTTYERYWHGTIPILRLLLHITDIQGIKSIGMVVLYALVIGCFYLLLRFRYYSYAVGLLLGLILCQFYLVPMCIEYYSCFALFFLALLVILFTRKKQIGYEWLFVLIGALVCFFDFLSCEILTLFMPLLLLLYMKKESFRNSLYIALRYGSLWFVSYAFTWISKWILCAVVFDKSIFEIALGQGALRLAGDVRLEGDMMPQFISAILVNLSLMFPFRLVRGSMGVIGVLLGCSFVLFCAWYLLRKKQVPGAAVLCLLCSLAPAFRYAFVNNHALLHPFFTYRDLIIMTTSLAVFCAMSMTIPVRKKRKR